MYPLKIVPSNFFLSLPHLLSPLFLALRSFPVFLPSLSHFLLPCFLSWKENSSDRKGLELQHPYLFHSQGLFHFPNLTSFSGLPAGSQWLLPSHPDRHQVFWSSLFSKPRHIKTKNAILVQLSRDFFQTLFKKCFY